MRKTFTVLAILAFSTLIVVQSGTRRAFAQQDQTGISDAALQQIADVQKIKNSFTYAENKIDANLVFAAMSATGQLAGTSIDSVARDAATTDAQGNVTVDIAGNISGAVVDAVVAANGTVLNQSPRFGMLRASVPLTALDSIASNADVRTISNAAQYMTNAGALTSQGYVTHAANQAVAAGYNGAGVTVGVLSDSASAARISALISTGDLPASAAALAGQNGTGTDEGAAMMEIVHDIAPGANVLFATANGGVANFASNILALQAAGASVIVDDVTYFNEGAFQDGPIAQAVTQVTNAGAIYFSSAANSGNLTSGTSGTWEGDFVDGGPVGPPISTAGETGRVHNFNGQPYDVLTAATTVISLKWSDPLAASTNDYDLFVLNSTGTSLVAFSAAVQNGTQDPLELVSRSAGFPAGSRIVVVQFSGAARALRVDTNRGRLSIATAGSTYGHNAGASTMSTAATYWNSARTGTRPFTGFANPDEVFSSDGPRKIFYNPNGTPITPGNVLFGTNGGTTLQKPDIAAADGVSAKTPGFLPFFGTSASAPHAAGIAALIRSVRPDYTPAQVRAAMLATALDSMAPGVDRDSGYGIVMALPAVQYALIH